MARNNVKTIKLTTACVVMIVGSYFVGYGAAEMKAIKQRVDIVKQNSEIIESLSGVAMSQSYVTDLLLRVSHYTDNHVKGNHICMECEGTEFEFDEVEDVGVEVEETHKQIMSDLREIETSIDSLTFGNLQQIRKLENMLKAQRAKIKPKELMAIWYGGVDCE
tara:strand:+ start:538 stop:1026 length:489 start_codon:yes stop_codon:yes gene_type:complete